MSASGVNRTILHVDDDPQFTRIVAHQLRQRGYDVVSINDPQAALAELVRHGYRIVILDIDMPGVDGIELMRRIKEYDGGIQVIMLTGLVTLSSAMAAFRRGAEACFFKPLESIDELSRAIDATSEKIEHWWQALNNLTRQRRAVENGSDASSVRTPARQTADRPALEVVEK
jgi:DNA-binding response OmpR family regulator